MSTGPDIGSYYHELFLKGCPALCRRIRRHRVKGNRVKAAPSPLSEPDFYKMEWCESSGPRTKGLSGYRETTGVLPCRDPSKSYTMDHHEQREQIDPRPLGIGHQQVHHQGIRNLTVLTEHCHLRSCDLVQPKPPARILPAFGDRLEPETQTRDTFPRSTTMQPSSLYMKTVAGLGMAIAPPLRSRTMPAYMDSGEDQWYQHICVASRQLGSLAELQQQYFQLASSTIFAHQPRNVVAPTMPVVSSPDPLFFARTDGTNAWNPLPSTWVLVCVTE